MKKKKKNCIKFEHCMSSTYKWVDYANNMFQLNSCTNNGRVAIDYCPNTNAVVVRVLSAIATINCDEYTDYGLMMEIMKVVDCLYNDEISNEYDDDIII